MKRLLSAVLLLAISSTAFAQAPVGDITFVPVSFAVPIFGGIGLLLLSLFMGGAAFRFFRKGTSGHTAAISALAVGAIVASVSGVQLVGKSWAPTAWVETITSSSGGTFDIRAINVIYDNQSGVDLLIADIRTPGCMTKSQATIESREMPDPIPSFTCQIGRILPNGDACEFFGCVDEPGGTDGGSGPPPF